MAVEHLFASIPVSNRARALDYYKRLAGRPPDLIPNDIEAAWQLAPGRWIYFIVDRDRAGAGLNTLLVDDLDGFMASAAQRGIAAGPEHIVGDSTRQVILTDPDGNRLKIAQVPEGG